MNLKGPTPPVTLTLIEPLPLPLQVKLVSIVSNVIAGIASIFNVSVTKQDGVAGFPVSVNLKI
ncbi:hypothetical protein D3C81_2212900 [compost metagenome]